MTSSLVATFDGEAALKAAADAARAAGHPIVDAFTPYAIEGLQPEARDAGWIAWAACFGAVLGAGGTFALEVFSATTAYPFNSGGRPGFSWPVFLLAAFEIGVLCAGFCAFAAFLLRTGLPRLHHAAFDIEGIERASQDRFLLVVARPAAVDDHAALIRLLKDAVDVREAIL
jgi:hypothetical protein